MVMSKNEENSLILSDVQRIFLNQHFKGVDLSKQKIHAKEFDNCHFIDCNLTEVNFIKCKFSECLFKNCNLSMIKVNGCSFFDVIFEDSKAIGVNWTMAHWPTIKLSAPVKFYKCILNDSSFLGLSLSEMIMTECKAHDVDFREADCAQADFSYTDFTNSLFNKTNLTEANFRGATHYNIDIFLNEIKRAKFSLTEAINLLNSLEIELVE